MISVPSSDFRLQCECCLLVLSGVEVRPGKVTATTGCHFFGGSFCGPPGRSVPMPVSRAESEGDGGPLRGGAQRGGVTVYDSGHGLRGVRAGSHLVAASATPGVVPLTFDRRRLAGYGR